MWRPADRTVEASYPWVGGVIAWVLASRFVPAWLIGDPARSLVDPLINVAAIAIAFFVAVAAILAPLKSDPVIRELQRIDAFPVMLGYLRSAIYVWAAAIVVGLLVKVMPAGAVALGSFYETAPHATQGWPHPTWLRVLIPIWIAVLVAGTLCAHRMVRVLFALLRYRDPKLVRTPTPEAPDDDEALRLPPERRRRTAGG